MCASPRGLVGPLQQQSMSTVRARGGAGHFTFCRLISCVDVPTAPACEEISVSHWPHHTHTYPSLGSTPPRVVRTPQTIASATPSQAPTGWITTGCVRVSVLSPPVVTLVGGCDSVWRVGERCDSVSPLLQPTSSSAAFSSSSRIACAPWANVDHLHPGDQVGEEAAVSGGCGGA
jgi:hypothetical protein